MYQPKCKVSRLRMSKQELAYLLPLILAWIAKRERTP